MKPVFRTFIIFLLSIFIFNSCKNDLKLNAPYKEIPSVYAVLNPQDKIQMIRINKVFLGEANANTMAQVADSINYEEGELEVTLTRSAFGVASPATPTGNKQVITFRDSMVVADDGSFNKNQRVYVTSDKLFVNGDYVLTIKNKKTNNVFTAKAAAIDSVKGNIGVRPFTTNYVYPYPLNTPLDEYIDYASNDGGTIRFIPNTAIIYQLVIRMHFYDLLYNGEKTYNYVDYAFGNQNVKSVQNIGNIGYITYSFKKADVFSAAGYGLSRMNLDESQITKGRKMYKIQFLVYSTTQDYLDYTQYVSPSFSIDQNKPLYSNFDNKAALGLFTFRTRCSVNKEMATFFITEFAYNPFTCAYKFYTASDGLPGCTP